MIELLHSGEKPVIIIFEKNNRLWIRHNPKITLDEIREILTINWDELIPRLIKNIPGVIALSDDKQGIDVIRHKVK